MDILRRQHAPLNEDAWVVIEEHIRQILTARLTARRVVDVDGPYGLDYSAVNLGQLSETRESAGVNYALRKLLPLVEVRVPFELSIWELDNLARGSDQIDLDSATQAALKIANFEEKAVYEGFLEAQIHGLASAAGHDPVALGESPKDVPQAIAAAVQKLTSSGVSGPYALVLPQGRLAELASDTGTYPPMKRVESLLQGGFALGTEASEGSGFVLSLRGGDASLTLGQDLTIGYDYQDATTVKLYLTESFTFRVLGEEAIVRLVP